MRQQLQLKPLQTMPVCLNGKQGMATVDIQRPDSIELRLAWADSASGSWTGSYGTDFVAKELPGRTVDALTRMLLAALTEQSRPASDLRLHLEESTRVRPDRCHLVLTYRTRFDQLECRLPLNRQQAGSASNGEPFDENEIERIDAAGLLEAARQLEQENARLRRENARLRPDADALPQLRLEVAALHEAARGLEVELKSVASITPRQSVANAGLKKLQSEARELRAMERVLQLRLRQVLQELALHKRTRVHGPRVASSASTESTAASRMSTPRSQRFDPTAYVAERRQHRRPTSADSSHQIQQRQPEVVTSSAKKIKSRSRMVAVPLDSVEEDVLQIDERLDRLQSFLNKALIVRS